MSACFLFILRQEAVLCWLEAGNSFVVFVLAIFHKRLGFKLITVPKWSVEQTAKYSVNTVLLEWPNIYIYTPLWVVIISMTLFTNTVLIFIITVICAWGIILTAKQSQLCVDLVFHIRAECDPASNLLQQLKKLNNVYLVDGLWK